VSCERDTEPPGLATVGFSKGTLLEAVNYRLSVLRLL
jgi:hypothetical protein